MNLRKQIRYDLNFGILHETKRFLVAMALFFSLCAYYALRYAPSLPISATTLGNLMLTILSGQPAYDPNSFEPFRFPAAWMLLFVLLLYFVLNYPFDDLHGFGKQLLINSGNRMSWWLSKTIWTIALVTVYWLLLWLVAVIYCLATGTPLSLSIDANLLRELAIQQTQFTPYQVLDITSLTAQLTLIPWFAAISIALVQLSLSLVLTPPFAFVISIAQLLAASYYTSPFLLGNYAMAVRSARVIDGGISTWQAAIILPIVSILATILGLIRFGRYDILKRGRSETSF